MNTAATRIKICGLRRLADIQAVNNYRPDFAGFVFTPGKRQVTPEVACGLISQLHPSIKPVGVFVGESDDEICRIAAMTGLQAVQLHGKYEAGRIGQLRRKLFEVVSRHLAIWQCLGIPAGKPSDLALPDLFRLVDQSGSPDAWLLDSQMAGRTGGTGQSFDWEAFRNLPQIHRIILAGGLDPGNVGTALSILHPSVVDCSSGVETNGWKDPVKIKNFCDQVRIFDRQNRGHPGRSNLCWSIRSPNQEVIADMTNADDRVWPDERGRFGRFGGRFAAETLMPALAGLEKSYREARQDPAFQADFQRLLCDYAGRPSLLYLAERLSSELGVTVLLKREDLNHTGAHKINNVLGQVLLARRMGKRRLIAETGAGQHGVATATAAALFGLSCDVFMGAEDTARQSLNVYRMELLGARVHAVSSGTATLKDATSEAMREWSRRADDSFYVIGSTVGPHPYPMIVRDFQRVIGDEIRSQMRSRFGRLPAALIACVGGGSNAMGTFFSFLGDPDVRLIGAEAGGEGLDGERHAATLARGSLGVFHGMCSLFLQDDDGQIKPVYSLSAGLDYPGVGPEHVFLQDSRRAVYHAVSDREAVDAFTWLARMEGIIPAIESAHALALLRKLAQAGEFAADDPIVVTLSGRGDKDVASIQAWQREHDLITGASSTETAAGKEFRS